MNRQEQVLSNLQESTQFVYEATNADENSKHVDTVEYLQDRFDALLQIIETQAHRVSFLIRSVRFIFQLLRLLEYYGYFHFYNNLLDFESM